MRVSFTMLLAICIVGCAGPKVNVVRNQTMTGEPIRTIALMPGGGVMADAIGIELLNYKLNVIDTTQVTNFMIRENLNEIEITQSKNLSRLSDEGIDAVIFVKSVAGYDRKPQSASVKIIRTTDGQLMVGANWQNGHGGVEGSMADRDMRVDVAAAAKQIANAIGPVLQASPKGN